MILVSQDKKSPHYEARRVAGGWSITENGRHMAACFVEADAKAIASALNFKRFILAARPLVLARPRGNPELN